MQLCKSTAHPHECSLFHARAPVLRRILTSSMCFLYNPKVGGLFCDAQPVLGSYGLFPDQSLSGTGTGTKLPDAKPWREDGNISWSGSASAGFAAGVCA